MRPWEDRPSLEEARRIPCAPRKGLPSALEKEEKKKVKNATEASFRAAVWRRDDGKDRSTDKPVSRSAIDWNVRGEVHHVLKRSTNPKDKFLLSRGILLSAANHRLAETRCPNAPEHLMLEITGPGDLGQPQRFDWRNVDGVVTKTRIG